MPVGAEKMVGLTPQILPVYTLTNTYRSLILLNTPLY